MTDGPIDPARFVDTDDELTFDDVEPAPPPPKPRRALRKGAPAPDATPEVAAAPPEPIVATEPAEAPAPAPPPAEASFGTIPSPLRRYALPALVGLSMVSSFASLGGLVAVGRSLAALDAEHARVAERHEAPAGLPETIARLDRAAATLAAATPRTPTSSGGVTADELRHGLDDLRLALADRQPQGVAALAAQNRSSFSELAARLDRIELALRRPAPAKPAR